ncbi:MAG: phosphodiester glycosidase family protein [Lachnospiraceae bacterium]|nr:phosphodiester glycosidase family protein [Lachnospiraceae bacterium]
MSDYRDHLSDPTYEPSRTTAKSSKRKKKKTLRTIKRTLLVVVTTLMLVIISLLGVLFTVFRGPSESMRRLVTLSFYETSAMKWVPGLFMPAEQVEGYISSRAEAAVSVTNTDLIQIDTTHTGVGLHGYTQIRGQEGNGSGDAEVVSDPDADGDGIIIEEVNGPTYSGYMMIVQDPTRLFLGTPEKFGDEGLTIYEMVEKYECVAAINGGGFIDPNGTGNGGLPDGIVVNEGVIVNGADEGPQDMVGFDDRGILLVGRMSPEECMEMHMQYGVHFGPSLIIDGVPQNDSGEFFSGVNPRTAIGQRSDGAVLMLVIDGRQIYSPGATLVDLVDVMLEYGAVNASNLDGGSSTMMIYNGELVNHCASVIGPRKIPTCFLVRPQE